jgi:hypothetical protein
VQKTDRSGVDECNRDFATIDVPTSSVLRKTLRVFEQIDNVVNDFVNFATIVGAPCFEGNELRRNLVNDAQVILAAAECSAVENAVTAEQNTRSWEFSIGTAVENVEQCLLPAAIFA